MGADIEALPSRAEALRTLLETRRATLVAEHEAVTERLRVLPARGGEDEGDRANQHVQQDLEAAQLQRTRQALRELDGALARQAAGNYGQCEACGGEISLARLRSVPTARFCKRCQEAREAA